MRAQRRRLARLLHRLARRIDPGLTTAELQEQRRRDRKMLEAMERGLSKHPLVFELRKPQDPA